MSWYEQPLVAVVDACPNYRRGLRGGLEEAGLAAEEPADPVTWAGGGGRRVVVYTPEPPDPGAVVAGVGQANPAAAVVALLWEASASGYGWALRLGAHGACARQSSSAAIAEVVRRAAVGDVVLPVEVARTLAAAAGADEAPGWLTTEHVELLRQLDQGLTLPAIARRLHISERSVSRQVANLLAALDVPGRTQALVLAHRWGLLRATSGDGEEAHRDMLRAPPVASGPRDRR